MSCNHRARLCTLQKWENYSGYGFSLQATKGKVGHYISEVDQTSPAFAAGLRDGDYVVEVNGVNVVPDQHQEVVQRILKNPSKVSLLLLDPESKAYFENHSIAVNKFMVDIVKINCPAVNPFTSDLKVNGRKESVSDKSESERIKPEKSSTRPSSTLSLSQNNNSTSSIRHSSPVYSNRSINNQINGDDSFTRENSLSKESNKSIPTTINDNNSDIISNKSTVVSGGRRRVQHHDSLSFSARAKIVNDL
ncbi:unnamed protein product [Schistosoma turkestanicum]|nr:unnamed protein product [Schistosoma turkestanicum]